MEIFRKDDDHKTCLHDKGFVWISTEHMDIGYPAVWLCANLCGYYLNFDPSKFPEGVAYTQEAPEGKKQFPPYVPSKY